VLLLVTITNSYCCKIYEDAHHFSVLKMEVESYSESVTVNDVQLDV